MIRKFVLPALAVALLGGCMTAGYSYRSGNGDYYHGAPSVEYRYRTPYPYQGYGWYPYGYRYAHPYGYRHHYYYNPYGYGYPYYYRTVPRTPRVDHTPDRNRSHWRNLDRNRRPDQGAMTVPPPPRRTVAPPQPRTDPAPRREGSSIGGMVRRAKHRDLEGKTP